MKNVLGVDIGGVIFDNRTYLNHSARNDELFMSTPAIQGSFEALATLNTSRFKDAVFLISRYHKAHGPQRMQEWLARQQFYERTGIPESHLYQCEERHQKAPIVKELGITHFVDDRAEVMSHFADIVPHLYLFQGTREESNEWAPSIPQLKYVENWEELLAELML
jgi:hypothetical protein